MKISNHTPSTLNHNNNNNGKNNNTKLQKSQLIHKHQQQEEESTNKKSVFLKQLDTNSSIFNKIENDFLKYQTLQNPYSRQIEETYVNDFDFENNDKNRAKTPAIYYIKQKYKMYLDWLGEKYDKNKPKLNNKTQNQQQHSPRNYHSHFNHHHPLGQAPVTTNNYNTNSNNTSKLLPSSSLTAQNINANISNSNSYLNFNTNASVSSGYGSASSTNGTNSSYFSLNSSNNNNSGNINNGQQNGINPASLINLDKFDWYKFETHILNHDEKYLIKKYQHENNNNNNTTEQQQQQKQQDKTNRKPNSLKKLKLSQSQSQSQSQLPQLAPALQQQQNFSKYQNENKKYNIFKYNKNTLSSRNLATTNTSSTPGINVITSTAVTPSTSNIVNMPNNGNIIKKTNEFNDNSLGDLSSSSYTNDYIDMSKHKPTPPPLKTVKFDSNLHSKPSSQPIRSNQQHHYAYQFSYSTRHYHSSHQPLKPILKPSNFDQNTNNRSIIHSNQTPSPTPNLYTFEYGNAFNNNLGTNNESQSQTFSDVGNDKSLNGRNNSTRLPPLSDVVKQKPIANCSDDFYAVLNELESDNLV